MSVPVNRERLENEVHTKTRKGRELTHVTVFRDFTVSSLYKDQEERPISIGHKIYQNKTEEIYVIGTHKQLVT